MKGLAIFVTATAWWSTEACNMTQNEEKHKMENVDQMKSGHMDQMEYHKGEKDKPYHTADHAHFHPEDPQGAVKGRIFGEAAHITNQKALKAFIEAQLLSDTPEPLIFSAVSLPEKLAHEVGGAPLKIRSALADSLTTFVRNTIVDKVLWMQANEAAEAFHVEAVENELELELTVLSDVPSLIHMQNELNATTPLGQQVKEIQRRMLEKIAQLSTAEVDMGNLPKSWNGHEFDMGCECCKMQMIEGTALKELHRAIEAASGQSVASVVSAEIPSSVEQQSEVRELMETQNKTRKEHERFGEKAHEKTEKPLDVSSAQTTAKEVQPSITDKKPIVLVALNQAIGCFLDHHMPGKALMAVEMFHNCGVPGIKVVVPVKHRASLEATINMAKHSTDTATPRKLQAEVMVADSMAHLGDLDFAAAIANLAHIGNLEFAALDNDLSGNRDLQQAQDKAPKKAALSRAGPALSGTDSMTFWGLEKRQITLWTGIGLAFTALLVVYATAFMRLNKDPLLYTKIYTGGAISHQS